MWQRTEFKTPKDFLGLMKAQCQPQGGRYCRPSRYLDYLDDLDLGLEALGSWARKHNRDPESPEPGRREAGIWGRVEEDRCWVRRSTQAESVFAALHFTLRNDHNDHKAANITWSERVAWWLRVIQEPFEKIMFRLSVLQYVNCLKSLRVHFFNQLTTWWVSYTVMWLSNHSLTTLTRKSWPCGVFLKGPCLLLLLQNFHDYYE